MKLIAIDGNSLMHRAFYALPNMTSRNGTPTGALHGFLSMLIKLIEKKPDYLVVAFDMPIKTFRHEKYSEYKAGRRETPPELRAQFTMLREILIEMGIRVIECERYEADDILGTLSRMAMREGMDALLVTGDRDALQLITDRVHILMTKKGITETVEYDEATLKAEYGLEPARMVDLKGLMGDSSDNLPGVRGVGEKTALKLLEKYGTLDAVLDNAENEKGALKEKLTEGRSAALMSRKLGTIDVDAPVGISTEDCRFSPESMKKALPTLSALELRSVYKRIDELSGSAPAPIPVSNEKARSVICDEQTLSDTDALAAAVRDTANCRYFAFDITEDAVRFAGFDGEYPSDGAKVYALTLGGNLLEPGLMPDEVIAALKPVLENQAIKKVVFDAKRLMHLTSGYGAELVGVEFDAMIADYLLNALHPSKELSVLISESGLNRAPVPAALMRLRAEMLEKLGSNGMLSLFRDIEMPLVSTLFDMERTGFMTDREVLVSLGGEMTERIEKLSADIYALAGEEFNILSPRQLGSILFEKLGLPPKKKTKTGYSTDSDVLEALKPLHPIVPLVTEYRFLTKLRSTFIDAMLEKIGADGRIHTTFNQAVTATGRISSTEPNLQNIPVRTELGRQIRRAFVASPGNLLVGADYSQIELRVLAHISGDDTFISAFNAGEDIHARTAAEIFGVDRGEVTREMRSSAKAVNFGIVYGISAFGLAEQLGIPQKRAASYIDRYLERCTGVRDYMRSSVEAGKFKGYAETLFGRRRMLTELASSNFNTRSFGERVAMNMPIQGTAADIIKAAMVRVHNGLVSGGFKAKLVLQIHDELIIDTPTNEVERVKTLLHDAMVNVIKLAVPLVADVESGHSWFDTK
ncbi:MAG: DNA polymerase I [Clostridia bacterium]|nr:DNA polymerase I [Clostridia bacterium]